jgi:periplasmic protein TonB
LFQSIREFAGTRSRDLRARLGSRLAGLVLALLVELVLVLAILSLDFTKPETKPATRNLVSMDIKRDADPSPAKPKAEPVRAARALQQPRAARVAPKPPDPPAKLQKPAIIPVSRERMAALDISNLPRGPAPTVPSKAPTGPPDLGVPGDSKRVGSAPNGMPMYAAAWYREPYDDELSGYLSTAEGPGWGLIACRTAPDFRVEDCVGLGEYPLGSRIERAVLAAAWQFRVRPPRVGGVSQVGSWVRIRIDYGIKRK